MFKTLQDFVGNTPLVRLVRIPGAENDKRNNVILAKLEGNNPAGSVKDRPALSMIVHAEARGDIKPGDTLIEATSGNTGIDLAGVFVQIGLVPNTEWLKGAVELSKYGEIIVDAKGATSVPGVFAAGDATTTPYKQIIIAAGEGAKAALSAFDHLIRHGVQG